MRRVSLINIDNILKPDRYPLCKQTLNLANKLSTGRLTIEDLPPIHTELKSGSHIIKDGRHRYTAVRLAGINKIKCRYGCNNSKRAEL